MMLTLIYLRYSLVASVDNNVLENLLMYSVHIILTRPNFPIDCILCFIWNLQKLSDLNISLPSQKLNDLNISLTSETCRNLVNITYFLLCTFSFSSIWERRTASHNKLLNVSHLIKMHMFQGKYHLVGSRYMVSPWLYIIYADFAQRWHALCAFDIWISWSLQDLDSRCEQLIKEEFGVECNFDVVDAVKKLEKLGIVSRVRLPKAPLRSHPSLPKLQSWKFLTLSINFSTRTQSGGSCAFRWSAQMRS